MNQLMALEINNYLDFHYDFFCYKVKEELTLVGVFLEGTTLPC
jgi:hypothetical protein